MYPHGELTHLAARKTLLQARITVRRLECTLAVMEIARPFAWIDRALQTWHRISPMLRMLGVPLGLLVTRVFARKRQGKPTGKSRFAALMAALPIILRFANMIKDARAAHAGRPAVGVRSW
jgi:hypothetical protein